MGPVDQRCMQAPTQDTRAHDDSADRPGPETLLPHHVPPHTLPGPACLCAAAPTSPEHHIAPEVPGQPHCPSEFDDTMTHMLCEPTSMVRITTGTRNCQIQSVCIGMPSSLCMSRSMEGCTGHALRNELTLACDEPASLPMRRPEVKADWMSWVTWHAFVKT